MPARRCEVEFAIIRGMKPIATANYDFEKLFRGLKIAKKKWNWAQAYPVIDEPIIEVV